MVCSVSKCKLSKRLNMVTGSFNWDLFLLSLTEKINKRNTVIKST